MTDSGSQFDVMRLGYFSASAVSRLAQREGTYRRYGLDVVEDAVPSSTEQMRRLLGGRYDLVLTSPDNVLNYRVNQHEGFQRSDVRILAAVDLGLGLSLMASPGITSIDDLRGRRVGVDVPDSGFAYALYEVLSRAGLARGEYDVVTMGSTPGRATGLLAHRCDATLLNAGHDLLAEADGAHRLARISEVLGSYPGSVLAAPADGIRTRPDLYRRFAAAWAEAVQATVDPLNRDRVVSELAAGLAASPEVAQAAYSTLLDPAEGLVADGRFDPDGWRLVVDLRLASNGLDADIDRDVLGRNVPVIDTHTTTSAEQG